MKCLVIRNSSGVYNVYREWHVCIPMNIIWEFSINLMFSHSLLYLHVDPVLFSHSLLYLHVDPVQVPLPWYFGAYLISLCLSSAFSFFTWMGRFEFVGYMLFLSDQYLACKSGGFGVLVSVLFFVLDQNFTSLV